MNAQDTERIARAIREIPELADAFRKMLIAIQKSALALTAFGQHLDRHHSQEQPDRSVMHARHDLRRRARRHRKHQ